MHQGLNDARCDDNVSGVERQHFCGQLMLQLVSSVLHCSACGLLSGAAFTGQHSKPKYLSIDQALSTSQLCMRAVLTGGEGEGGVRDCGRCQRASCMIAANLLLYQSAVTQLQD